MNARHLIFDLDGTLIDSAPSILDCMAAVINEAGIEPVVPLHVALIGPPLMVTLARIAGLSDEARLQSLAQAFKARYDSEGLRATRAYSGIADMLGRLHGDGLVLHLATNKRRWPTLAILDLLGWSTWFSSVYTQDSVTPGYADKAAMISHQLRENRIDPAKAVYIGDIREDGLAAAANALHFFAVDWGYGRFEGWEGVPSWTRVASPLDLVEALAGGADAR